MHRFVTEKTVLYSGSLVDVAEQSLDSPLVQKLLTDKHVAAIRHEIAEYRNDPSAYVSDLTRKAARVQQKQKGNPLLEKVASVKQRIRAFYNDTLAALIGDLRIFSISNFCAGAIALGLAIRSRASDQQSAVWFSFLMFVAVLYCGFMYVNDLTFFRILFRSHMGWWYPVLLCLVLAGLYKEYARCGGGEHDALSEQGPSRQANQDFVA